MDHSHRRLQPGSLLVIMMVLNGSLLFAQTQPQYPLGGQPTDAGSQIGTNTSSSPRPVPTNSASGMGPETGEEDLSSQETGLPSHSSPASASGDYVLNVGDTIELTVYREPDLGIRSKIGNDGMVQLPLLGEIKLAGLPVRSASSLIRQKYDADYLVNPQIYLDVVFYHPCKFSVGGEVGRPGSYDFSGGEAPGLLDAIGIAGGFLSSADRGNIVVKRREGDSVKTIMLNARDSSDPGSGQFKVQQGDDINVGEAKFTIIGQVSRPGTYDFGDADSLDLLEAIGMAGGFTRIADRGHIQVKRHDGKVVRTFKVNARRFSDDRTDNFEIKPGDVIEVGESWY